MIRVTKIYSVMFSLLFLSTLLFQLFIPNLSLASIPDHFRWRMALIRDLNTFRYAVGDSIFNEGLVGTDGWLFYTGDYSIHDYQKTELLGKGRLNQLADILNSLDQETAQYGGALWVMIPPDKNTIYPQYMPHEIHVIGKKSRLDQLIGYLQSQTEINVLDLRPIFIDASQSSQIYYKADAHWNCLGAYHASNEILTQINALHPEAQTHPLSDFEFGVMTDSTLDISGVMGLGFQEETVTLTPNFPTGLVSHAPYDKNESMIVVANSQTNLPSALVIHDSFYTECFNQFFEPQFSRVIFSHYEKALLSDYLEVIEVEKPDIVVVEFAERHIEYFFKLMTSKDE
jgi:alginate O-acetyltransferase complex protein AlgJ